MSIIPMFFATFLVLILLLTTTTTTTFVVNGKKSSSPSSSIKLPSTKASSSELLKLHKLYTLQPPHDMTLYSILEVSPNATSIQITKTYRKLSRQYHPDKRRSKQHRQQHQQSESEDNNKLRNIQNAYDILKDDDTRLLYHKYGICDPHLAIILLLGPTRPDHYSKLDPIHYELLQLIGRDFNLNLMCSDDDSTAINNKGQQQQQQRERVILIAARIVELLRPIIEGTVHPHIIAHQLAQDCDRLKTLPLGAQIIRCVGRAYRHAGQDYLKQHPTLPPIIRKKWHTIKGYWTAIVASSRAITSEKQLQLLQQKQQNRKRKNQQGKSKTKKNTIEFYDNSDDDPFDIGFLEDNYDDDEDEELGNGIDVDDDDDVVIQKLEQQLKTKNTVLQAQQVEALWQITKIDISNTVRNACDTILNGQYFFFPSHQEDKMQQQQPVQQDDVDGVGWVSSSGKVIYADEARIEAAKALILLGNVMVQRSKDGTAWKE